MLLWMYPPAISFEKPPEGWGKKVALRGRLVSGSIKVLRGACCIDFPTSDAFLYVINPGSALPSI
eukprot:223292-Prymnesium_polylepis.1